MMHFIKNTALATLALGLIAIPAAAQDADESMETLYDRGERSLDFLALERGTGGFLDPVSTGSIAPRAAFSSAPTLAPQPQWWAAHEAIRLEAEDH